MDTYLAVLPTDVIDSVILQIDQSSQPSRPPRFLRLPHPRTGLPSLFLPYQPLRDKGNAILEVQTVAPPGARSWFLGEEVVSGKLNSNTVANGRLLVMTPIDPLFLLIPILGATTSEGAQANFRPADDIFEEAATKLVEASHPSGSQDPSLVVTPDDIMTFGALDCTMHAMKRICDAKEITADITVFRYSQERLIEQLRKKVTALATPRITEMSRCLIRGLAKNALMEDKHEDLLTLGRTQLACDLLAQYLPPDIRKGLMASYDFAPLESHVRTLSRHHLNPSPPGSVVAKKDRKRTSTFSEGNSGNRKKEPKASHGVEKLKRANVDGMAKLSSFFVKKDSAN
ncbi:ribonuclease H2, subunit B [Pisolithus marmoratus]|nr:ribonuclease H2, subunit B [Pisolithus marmoratus]